MNSALSFALHRLEIDNATDCIQLHPIAPILALGLQLSSDALLSCTGGYLQRKPR